MTDEKRQELSDRNADKNRQSVKSLAVKIGGK